MANILKIVKDFNPKKALGYIFDKIDEILQVTNESAAAIAALPVQPKVYRATLTQTGTDAPVALKLENTLSDTPVWSRISMGSYKLTLNGEFVDQKVTLPYYDLGVNKMPLSDDSSDLGYYMFYAQSSTTDFLQMDILNTSFERVDLSTLIGTGSIFVSFEIYP